MSVEWYGGGKKTADDHQVEEVIFSEAALRNHGNVCNWLLNMQMWSEEAVRPDQ